MALRLRCRRSESAWAEPTASCANGAGLVYLPGVESKDFWLVDLATSKVRQLTDLSDRGYLNTFDITPDGNTLCSTVRGRTPMSC